jgi:hypothetical protein
MSTSLSRIRTLSRWVRALCVLGALVTVSVNLRVWSSAELVTLTAHLNWGLDPAVIHTGLSNRALGALASLLPLSVGLFVLWQVWQLFGAYGQGQIFTSASVLRLRRVASGMLALALAQPLAVALISLALTKDNPVGKRLLALNLSSHDYLALLFGLVMLAIASVMAEAQRVAEENAEFI